MNMSYFVIVAQVSEAQLFLFQFIFSQLVKIYGFCWSSSLILSYLISLLLISLPNESLFYLYCVVFFFSFLSFLKYWGLNPGPLP